MLYFYHSTFCIVWKGAVFMVKALEDIIAASSSIVFFGGAGVSTESGIPDFRSVDGLYHQKYDYPPETILSHTFWEQNPGNSTAFTGTR